MANDSRTGRNLPSNERGHPASQQCLEPEALLALAERGLDVPGASDLVGHVLGCPHCLALYAETRALVRLAEGEVRAALPARARSPRLGWGGVCVGFAVGVGAACAVMYVAFLQPLRSRMQELRVEVRAAQKTNGKLSDEAARLAGRLRDAQDAKHPESVSSVPGSPDDAATLLALVVTTGRLVVPAEIDSFAATSRERGLAAAAGGLDLVRPVDTCIDDRRPVLAARPRPGARGAKAILVGPDGSEVPVEPLSAWSWRPRKRLVAGATYQWSAEANLGGRTVVSRVASIRTLSANATARLAKQKALYAKQPLLLAAIYARAGLLDDAEGALSQVLKQRPGHILARRLMGNLRSMRTGGR